MTPRNLLHNWSPCERCALHEHTFKQVIYSGPRKHCPLLFIGEAPGRTEQTKGLPFIGKSGRFLRDMIDTALLQAELEHTHADCGFTNILACVPWENPDDKSGFRPPTAAEAAACAPRLQAILDQRCDPATGIVLVGKTAERFLPPTTNPTLAIYHPSYLLRTGGRASKFFSRTIVDLRNFCIKLPLHGPSIADTPIQN